VVNKDNSSVNRLSDL